ncbi:hypothetical protein [Allocoleopsis sp.]|uniref:hypothetical protein n=1 Tax=Allocoleopsis sp. TaxID=3088169 RepID=UPI002FCFE063
MKLSMLKTLLLGIFLCIASTLLTANTALSNPLPQQVRFIAQTPVGEPKIEEVQPVEPAKPQESSSPEAGNSTTKNTSKDSETANQQGTNQESPSEAASKSKASQPAGPYDMEAIKAFNRALYGS